VTLVGATGHQHFPAEFIPTIVHEVRSRLSLLEPPLTGVCSLAAGADQLFAEQVLSLGGNLRVIVPSQGYESTFEEGDLEHYRQLLDRAETVEILQFASPAEAAFLGAGQRVVELSDLLLCIWDGESAKGLGGTADVVAYARDCGKPTIVIWPPGASR